MRQLLCWLLGHERKATNARQRTCVRCGVRETRRNYGGVIGWEVDGPRTATAR